MRQKLATLLGAAAMASLPAAADAGVIIDVRQVADPAPGLQAFIVTAVGTEGLTVGSVASLHLSDVHQVWANAIAGAAASTPKASNLTGPFWNPAWDALDTHLLLDTDSMLQSPGFGVVETNDATNPTGANLPGPSPFESFGGVAGMGELYFTGLAAQVTFAGDFRPSVDILHVVVPANTYASLDVTFIDSSSSGFIEYSDVLIGIPEPTGLSLLSLCGIAALRRRRTVQ